MKLVLATLIAFAAPAFAADIQVTGRDYSATQCHYYSSSLADLNFTYVNPQLPQGTRVVLRYGFHNVGSPTSSSPDWQHQSEVEMQSTGANQWTVDLNQATINERGGFAFDQVEFVFRVGDGFDNGGSMTGYYTAQLPQTRACEPGPMQALPVAVTKK